MTATPFATTVVALSTFNTISVALATVYQLTYPGTAYFEILNLGTGNLFLKGDATVSATDPASFKLPVNILVAPLINGRSGLFIIGDAAVTVSVMVVSKR
jgi:hypothetical protein